MLYDFYAGRLSVLDWSQFKVFAEVEENTMRNKESLRDGLNSALTQRVYMASKGMMVVYADFNENILSETLKDWEQQGYIKVLKDVTTAKDDEACIEMLSFIKKDDET